MTKNLMGWGRHFSQFCVEGEQPSKINHITGELFSEGDIIMGICPYIPVFTEHSGAPGWIKYITQDGDVIVNSWNGGSSYSFKSFPEDEWLKYFAYSCKL